MQQPVDKWLGRAVVSGVLAAAAALGSCDSGPRKTAREVNPVVRDVPSVLRGTVGAECTLRGVEPVLVSGYGLVVGLNGTGGGPYPVQVQSTMERELARGGIGKGGPMADNPLAGRSPRQVLADPNVAVVLVEGVISPGAPVGQEFDIRVRTLPGSSVSSLEGGSLWTTDMHLGPATTFGTVRTRKMAEGRGPIFINPFADPGASSPGGIADGVTRTVGRVMGGGRVTDPLLMELMMDNASHARAASIQYAINSRFPPGPGDQGDTARGRSGQSLAIRVPAAYREKTDQFVNLLRYLQIDSAFPQEFAKRYVEELKRTPAMANELSWCLEALGPPAVPFLAPLYDDPEFLPRMAALRAGARLGDPRTSPHLSQIAKGQTAVSPALRSEAIVLLGGLGPDPNVNFALRDLLDAPELEVRVAAYEALQQRGDATVQRHPGGPGFVIDVVPAADEMIYITQQGLPRIVLFGDPMRFRRPALVSAWQDRLMLSSEESAVTSDQPLRLYYRDLRTDKVTQTRLSDDLLSIVRFMTHKPTPSNPDPGLGLTYSETVGALYQIQRQGGVSASFATERDRLLAFLTEAQNVSVTAERPENEAQRAETIERARMLSPGRPGGPRPPDAPRLDSDKPRLVPLQPPKGTGQGSPEGGR